MSWYSISYHKHTSTQTNENEGENKQNTHKTTHTMPCSGTEIATVFAPFLCASACASTKFLMIASAGKRPRSLVPARAHADETKARRHTSENEHKVEFEHGFEARPRRRRQNRLQLREKLFAGVAREAMR